MSKQYPMLLLLMLGLLAPASALDDRRLADLERELGPLLQLVDVPTLQAMDAQLTPRLVESGTPDLVRVQAGIISHNLSRRLWPSGVKGNAIRAVDRLKPVAQGKDPELAALALSLLGSATALQGAEDWNPFGKISFVNQGWDLLDKAVRSSGDATWFSRLLRASVALSLPDFFGKASTVKGDLDALKAWDLSHPARMQDGVRAQLALMEGNMNKSQKQIDQAVEAWTRAVALDPKKVGAGKEAAASLEVYGP